MGAQVQVGSTNSHENGSVPYPRFQSEPLAKACEGKMWTKLLLGAGDAHQMRPGSGSGWLHEAIVASQLEDRIFPYVTRHHLRHTAASIAISAGANVKAVQRMLGHASAAMLSTPTLTCSKTTPMLFQAA
jgi:site-specific recombinase XerD